MLVSVLVRAVVASNATEITREQISPMAVYLHCKARAVWEQSARLADSHKTTRSIVQSDLRGEQRICVHFSRRIESKRW